MHLELTFFERFFLTSNLPPEQTNFRDGILWKQLRKDWEDGGKGIGISADEVEEYNFQVSPQGQVSWSTEAAEQIFPADIHDGTVELIKKQFKQLSEQNKLPNNENVIELMLKFGSEDEYK